jgi:hypothetical protein
MNNSIELVPQNEASIKLYEAQIEIAEFERKQALTRFTPKLDLIYYWGGTQYQQDFNLSFNSSDWQPNSYIGLTCLYLYFRVLEIKTNTVRQRFHKTSLD